MSSLNITISNPINREITEIMDLLSVNKTSLINYMIYRQLRIYDEKSHQFKIECNEYVKKKDVQEKYSRRRTEKRYALRKKKFVETNKDDEVPHLSRMHKHRFHIDIPEDIIGKLYEVSEVCGISSNNLVSYIIDAELEAFINVYENYGKNIDRFEVLKIIEEVSKITNVKEKHLLNILLYYSFSDHVKRYKPLKM